MSIQEVLAAQQRAANACRKPKAVPYNKTIVPSANHAIKDILAAQQKACKPTIKPAPAPKPAQSESIAAIIAKQRATAAAQKAAGSGFHPGLTEAQKADIAAIRVKYQTFLAEIEKELAAEDAKRIQAPTEPVVAKDPVVEVPPFTPSVPEEMEVVVKTTESAPDVNGISVGDEMGGQVIVTTRPKARRKRKANVITEPATEESVVVEGED